MEQPEEAVASLADGILLVPLHFTRQQPTVVKFGTGLLPPRSPAETSMFGAVIGPFLAPRRVGPT